MLRRENLLLPSVIASIVQEITKNQPPMSKKSVLYQVRLPRSTSEQGTRYQTLKEGSTYCRQSRLRLFAGRSGHYANEYR
jgi:hypothetical protein